jgi:hypothetical protein
MGGPDFCTIWKSFFLSQFFGNLDHFDLRKEFFKNFEIWAPAFIFPFYFHHQCFRGRALGDVVDKAYKPEYKWKTRNKTGMDKW